jgi:hypothetical protein
MLALLLGPVRPVHDQAIFRQVRLPSAVNYRADLSAIDSDVQTLP